jgi:hypothetical protein
MEFARILADLDHDDIWWSWHALQNLPRLWYRTMALQTSTEIYKGEVLHLPRRQPWPMLFPTIAQNRTTLSKHKKKRRSLIVWHNFNFSLKFKLFAIPMISWCHCSESHQGQHLSTKGRMYSRLPKWFSKFRCATLGEIPSAMASLAYGFYGQARHCKPLRLLEIPR